ncbi:hypothetical protein GGI25_003887 [Coemansia spiralis]|uniref:Asparagine synthetase domain-containing protein n=2 Tax=Coemansia TaxID=4863 RepID=A0A9W8G657_9FUNG|nr:hypothetical protein BX070DRAFT_231234 [Coemansia spiralis]KAJ1991066.1 hypothetical protein EDC05_003667 [Coemansia umbellata]KAJ2621121.1 hypothetical protein GGI26_004384 [Coemansia sp. RSA 1358]KAJ2675689.1 hypothetical protein GGI25_003887 [Coemansia spiralis]
MEQAKDIEVEAVYVRNLLLDVLSSKEAQTCDAILLSGGLDTSIASEAMLTMTQGTSGLRKGITVTIDPAENETARQNNLFTEQPQDVHYATKIAQKLKLEHHVLTPTLDELISGPMMELCIKVLRTFEGMELRNAVVIATALSHAKGLGCQRVCTGDGADELFAGYSFMHSMSDEKLAEYTIRMAKTMKFCAFPLAQAIGIEVWSPYLDPRVVDYAVSERGNRRELKIGQFGGLLQGKLVLRMAYPEVVSAGRKKAAIEHGCGTTVVPALMDLTIPDEEFAVEKAKALEDCDIVVRSKEHLAYFRVFKKAVLESDLVGRQRYVGAVCPDCKFALRNGGSSNYCDVCGLYPVNSP